MTSSFFNALSSCSTASALKRGLGSGLLVLVLASPLARGEMNITGGHVVVTGADLLGDTITVQPGASLMIESGTRTIATLLFIDTGGTVTGCGTIIASIQNDGDLVANCGQSYTLQIQGSVTNNGTVRISHSTSLDSNGDPWTNNGLLDLITGAGAPPATLINNGTLVTASSMPDLQISFGEGEATSLLQSYAPHTYQLLGTTNLPSETWQPIGSVQIGDNGTLTFTHVPDPAEDRYYYRYVVGD